MQPYNIHPHAITQLQHCASTGIRAVRNIRENALQHFLSAGLPTRHQEDWRYTNVNYLTQYPFDCALSGSQEIKGLPTSDTLLQLVWIDGNFCPTLSDLHKFPPAVKILSMAQAFESHSVQLMPYLNKTNLDNIFSALNTAGMTDGAFIMLPAEYCLKEPICLLFLLTAPTVSSRLHNLRNVIVLAENSQATIFERHMDLSPSNTSDHIVFKNIVTQTILDKGASLDYYKLQQEATYVTHIAHMDIQQSQDSHISHHTIALGAKLAREEVCVALNAKGASCTLNGFYIPHNTQQIDQYTRIDHYAPFTTSNEYYKGIITDHATGVFNGKVKVHPKAIQTKSQQINKNILLTQTAQMNMKPELEIYADDVQCTHGATIGPIEQAPLFYLRSRGIDTQAAMTMLIHAFYKDIVDRLPNNAIAKIIQSEIQGVLS